MYKLKLFYIYYKIMLERGLQILIINLSKMFKN